MSTPNPRRSRPPRPGTRRRLPATRSGITHKFSIAGFEGYLTANTYEDGSLGELFINDVGKEGSTLRGVLAMFAMATSVALAVRRTARGPRPQARADELRAQGPHRQPADPPRPIARRLLRPLAGLPVLRAATCRPSWASARPTRPAHRPARCRCSAAPGRRPPARPARTAAARCSAPARARPAPAAATTPAAANARASARTSLTLAERPGRPRLVDAVNESTVGFYAHVDFTSTDVSATGMLARSAPHLGRPYRSAQQFEDRVVALVGLGAVFVADLVEKRGTGRLR